MVATDQNVVPKSSCSKLTLIQDQIFNNQYCLQLIWLYDSSVKNWKKLQSKQTMLHGLKLIACLQNITKNRTWNYSWKKKKKDVNLITKIFMAKSYDTSIPLSWQSASRNQMLLSIGVDSAGSVDAPVKSMNKE